MGGNFAILNPCSKKWADLHGDGRSRYCDVCQKHVHAIGDYSADEWNQLCRDSNRHVCGLLCGESSTPPRSRRAILIGAVLTAVSPLWAQTGRVRIRVLDMTGAVLPHATVSLLGAEDRPIRSATADERGEVALTDLPLGDSGFLVIAPGFFSRRLTVTVRDANEKQVEAALVIGTIGETVQVETKPVQVPYSQTLDLPAAAAPASPQATPRKRKWWQIFR